MRENRSGCLVLFCSLIVPGLGQFIQARVFAGFSFFIPAFFLWFLFWVHFIEVFYYVLEHPGAKIPASDFFWDCFSIRPQSRNLCGSLMVARRLREGHERVRHKGVCYRGQLHPQSLVV